MQIRIERGVPMPTPRRKSHNDQGIAATLRALKPGESFFLPGRDSTYASRIIHREKKRRPGSDFASRTNNDGVRIWCLCDPAHDLLS